MGKACVYHFSANPKACVCFKHIEEIKAFAETNRDYIDHVYIDESLKQGEKTEYIKMKAEAEKYDKVYLRDAFHLNKWSLKAVADIKQIQSKGATVSTMSSGTIIIDDGSESFKKTKKVMFYHSRNDATDKRSFEVQNMAVELFCKEKTNWSISETIFEESNCFSVKAQPLLWQLEALTDRCDLMIVQSFSRIDLRTARFEKVINKLGVDIYSMQEGMLKVRKE